jgi:hypothetical protein
MAIDASDPYEAAAASLRRKEARLAAELDAVRRSLAAIEAARVAAGLPASSGGDIQAVEGSPKPAISSPIVPAIVSDKFVGLGLEQASAKVLFESDHIELTAKQIWHALSAAGYSLLSDRPEQSVSWALRKRERKVGDVILIGDGKWGMVDWYSQARLKELRETRNNASGRNSVEHVAKTKAGIANAIRNRRLERWGRRPSITADQMAKAYYARKSGAADTKLAMARAGKIVYPTFLSYWQVYEMENWKPAAPFPPNRRAVRKPSQEIKVKDMWPPDDEQTDFLKGNGTAAVSTVPH